MQFNLCIDQVRTLEWGLTLSEASLFSFIFNAGTWANKLQIIDGKEFRFLSRHKLCQELPCVTDKPDTMYRLMRSLHKKGAILFRKSGKRDMIHVTDKGQAWNSREKDKKICLNTENFPASSEQYPAHKGEIIPTNQKTISSNQETITSEIYALEKLQKLYDLMPNRDNYEKARYLWLTETHNKLDYEIDEMAEGVFRIIAKKQKYWAGLLHQPGKSHFSKTLAGLISEKPWVDGEDVPILHSHDVSWVEHAQGAGPEFTLDEAHEAIDFELFKDKLTPAKRAELDAMRGRDHAQLEQPGDRASIAGW